MRTPAISPATAGWASGNWIAAARSGTPWRSQTSVSRRTRSHDRVGRRLIVEVRPRARVGQHAAVHDPDHHHRDPLGDAARQQLGECRLVQQRVPPGDHEDVHVGLVGEPGEHRGLVHPGADRAHGPLAAQPLQGRVGAAQGRLPVLVGIVDVQDVDAVEPESLQALLDRPAHAVGAVVEDDAAALGAGVVGVIAGPVRLAVDVGARRDRIRGADQAPDLRGQDELVARPAGEGGAHPALRRPVAVQRRDVEGADPERPGVVHERDRVGVGDRAEEPADRCAAEAEARRRQAGAPERDVLEWFDRHPPRPSTVRSGHDPCV